MFKRQVEVLFRQGLAEVHHTGDQPSAALAGLLSGRLVGLLSAFLTSKSGDVAVQFGQDVLFDPGFQMNDYKTMLEFSLFGDPTLAIEDGDDPVNIPNNRPILKRLELLLDYFPHLAKLFELIFGRLI